MFDHSYIKATGQLWKLSLLFVLPLIGLGLIIFALSGILGDTVETSGVAFIAGLCLTLVGVIAPLLMIRCPGCKTRLLWRAIREQETGGWLSYILLQERCFVCGRSSDS